MKLAAHFELFMKTFKFIYFNNRNFLLNFTFLLRCFLVFHFWRSIWRLYCVSGSVSTSNTSRLIRQTSLADFTRLRCKLCRKQKCKQSKNISSATSISHRQNKWGVILIEVQYLTYIQRFHSSIQCSERSCQTEC